MKLLLTSGGLSTEEIKHELQRLVGKPLDQISVAIINEGHHVEAGDKRWAISEPAEVADIIGGEVDLVSLFALTVKEIVLRISQKDVLYVMGGHTDYLMSRIQSSGVSNVLPSLLEKIVYVGSSAGSMIMCNRINTDAYQKVYGEEGTYGVKKYLQIVNTALKPHLDSAQFLKNNKEILQTIATSYDGQIIALRDNQALAVEGQITKQTMRFVGGVPFILNPKN